MVFYDCGANIGFYTVVASGWVGASGSVFAFEPASSTFARLLGNVGSNALSNVRAWQVALGDREGVATLYQPLGEHHGLNTLARGGTEIAECRLTSLDCFVVAERLPAPGIIKVDVEGSELALLRGSRAILESSPVVVVVELSRATMRPFGYEPEDVVRYLRSVREYRVEWPFHGRLHRVDPDLPLPHYGVLGPNHGANYVFTPR